MISDLHEDQIADIEADVKRVRKKCIDYAHTYVDEKQISLDEFNEFKNKINRRTDQFLKQCEEVYGRKVFQYYISLLPENFNQDHHSHEAYNVNMTLPP